MRLKIEADKLLFDQWIEASVAVESLCSIVQNDMYLSSRQYDTWKIQVQQAIQKIVRLSKYTMEHVDKCNGF